ncbi:hypothetical protein GCM10027270_35640 [Nocardioides ginkgobilobae]
MVAERDSYYPPKWTYRLRRLLVRRSSLVVANSDAGAKYWLPVTSSVRVVPNIVQLPAPLATASPRRHVAVAGRMEIQKDPLRTARVSQRLAARGLTVDIYGSGSLEEQVKALCCHPSIVLHGYTRDLPTSLGASQVYLSLSRHEGSPNILAEAIMVGLRPVVSDIPEHAAVLGVEFPFLVAPEACEDQVADMVCDALALSDTEWDGLLGRVRQRLASHTGKNVATMYARVLEDLWT